MLKSLQQLFKTDQPTIEKSQQIDFICAVLLLEIAAADGKWQEEEILNIKAILIAKFQLTDAQSHTLIEQAKQSQQQATDLYQFTREINSQFDYPERCQLINKLWQVAFADNIIDPYEEQRIRKIADLLFVDHSDFIHGKIHAKANKS